MLNKSAISYGWGNIHINMGFLFLIALIVHLYYNWKPLINYLKDKAKKIKVFTPEFNAALVITIAFVVGTYLLLPPFSWIMSLNDHFKDSGAEKYGEPPYGHAELSSLRTFAKKLKLDLTKSMKLLDQAGYPVSKIVFADKSKAEGFAQNCGGEIIDYTRALQIAKASVAKENKMINARRLKKGKIVEPNKSDSCLVCGMYPIRYPYGKCQIKSKDGQTIHFCSTQCLFAFLGKQKLYVDTAINPFLIWVVDRNSGMWISGRTAFYVIGSKKVFGPMGYEALPFNSLKEAEDFAVENGGAAVTFGDVTIQKVVPRWKYFPKRAG